MGRPYKCPHCGAAGSVSKGVRRTKTMGERRLRLCKTCGRKFTPRNQEPSAEGAEPESGGQEPGQEPEEGLDPLSEESSPPLLSALDREWTP